MYIGKADDQDSITKIVANRRLMIKPNRPDWRHFQISIPIGVLLMLGARENNIPELVH